MRITIVGGGKVGYTIAENLANERHDITVIDTNDAVIEKINEDLDVLCIKGNGASISALKEADTGRADIFIATTSLDEVNMIACLAAKNLGAKYTIARIRDYEYSKEVELLTQSLKIDLAINPEAATAAQIFRTMRFSAANDVETFYHGRVELVGFRAREDDFFVNAPLSTIGGRFAGKPLLICTVEHKGETTIANGSTVIFPGDRVFIIGTTKEILRFFREIGRSTQRIRHVFVIGGGRICTYLSRQLIELNMDVKIVEQDYGKCLGLSEILPKALIVSGDGTDQDLLETENITGYDCFLALTGRDEDNIIASLFAKKMGVGKVISKVNRQNYFDIIDSLDIDSVVSPKLTTAYTIIRVVRGILNSHGSKMQALYKIAGGEAEAMEFSVGSSTRYLGTALRDLSTKQGILIAVIIRGGKIIVPEGSDCIMEGDEVIIISKDNTVLDINDIFAN